jgi:hypothetical protein
MPHQNLTRQLPSNRAEVRFSAAEMAFPQREMRTGPGAGTTFMWSGHPLRVGIFAQRVSRSAGDHEKESQRMGTAL